MNFLGSTTSTWIGSVQPRIVDISVHGTATFYIKLAGTDVLCKTDATGIVGYSLSTINCNVDCIDISDGLYYSMIQKQLETRPLELVFDNWITFGGSQSSVSAMTRFGLSTQSLDMLISSAHSATYYNQQLAIAIGSSQFVSRGDATFANSFAQFGVNNTYISLYLKHQHKN
jgi:hypothetical protein